MSDSAEYTKALKSLSHILNNPELVKSLKKIRNNAQPLIQFQKLVHDRLSSSGFDIFRNGFMPSPESIKRMSRIEDGLKNLRALDNLTQSKFFVYYRESKLSVVTNILSDYANLSPTEIQNNISLLHLNNKQKKELKLVKADYSNYVFSVLISVAVSVYFQLFPLTPLNKEPAPPEPSLAQVQKCLQMQMSKEKDESSAIDHDIPSVDSNSNKEHDKIEKGQ